MPGDSTTSAPSLPAALRSEATTPEQHYRRLTEENPAHAEAWRQRGLLALRQGRHQEAVELLEKAVALDPANVTALHHLASACQTLGQREPAARHLHKVVCLKPESGDAHNNWGIALIRLGRTAEAVAAFAQALRLKPDFPEAHNNWGNALAEQGQLDQAVDHFRAALRLHPAYPEGHNNLGLTLARLRRPEEAIAELSEARRLNPNYAEAANNLGGLYRDLGRLDEAVACFREAVRLKPDHPEPRFQLGLTLARLDRHEEAIACLHQCLLFKPDTPDVYNHLGMFLARGERFEEAAASFRQAVRLKPDSPDFLNNLGNTLLRQQKSEEAVSCFLQAVQVRPDYPLAHCNLGSALLEQGKVEEAITRYREAIRLKPDYIDAHFNLGNANRKARRSVEALACYQRVLELQPEHLGARMNIGVTYTEDGRLDEAVTIFEEIRRQKPDFADTYNCLGIARLHQHRSAEALVQFDQGLLHKPNDAEVHLNRALCMLLRGDYLEGWQEYEWRWKLKKAIPRPYPQPTWDGCPLPGGTIVLWGEQGMGDILQFIRYAPLVKERVGTVLVDCPGPLRGLLVSCPGIDALVGGNMPQPAPDVQAPLLSLPRILGTTLDTVPVSIPYLFVDAAQREAWRQKARPGSGLKVGVVWQGNPLFSGDRYRSAQLAHFRPLAEVPGVHLYSLQKGTGSDQLPPLARELRITDWGELITGDYRDTAAAIQNLDLVVSVDTSVAHLAGALGVPVWVVVPFNSDWRWLEGREDSVWYPSARIFRQERWGDWEELFVRVARALRERAAQPTHQQISLPLGLSELVERAVRQEIHHGRSEECWAALRQAGVRESDESRLLTGKLEAAYVAADQIGEEMQALEAAGDLDAQAAVLVRRFVRARQQQSEAWSGISAWLTGGQPPGA